MPDRSSLRPSFRSTTQPTWLPGSLRDSMGRSLTSVAGFALMGCALALLAGLISYDPRDISLNTVGGSGTVYNFLGKPGAYLVDFLWQGLASPMC